MPASLQSPLDIQLSKHNVKVKVGHQFVAGARREEGNREGERERGQKGMIQGSGIETCWSPVHCSGQIYKRCKLGRTGVGQE